MNILVDIVHPASVHLFRNFIKEMREKGHNVVVTARNKGFTFKLLGAYSIEYIVLGKHYKSMFGKMFGVLLYTFKLTKIIKQHKIDVLLDSCFAMYTGFTATITRKPIVNINNTDVSLFLDYSRYIISAYITPVSFKKDFGKKQLRCHTFNELAFLHPNYFSPNNKVLERLGLSSSDVFVLLRFVAWDAAEEIGTKTTGYTIDEIRNVVNCFSQHGKVLISCDYDLPGDLEKHHIEKMDNIRFGEIQFLEYYASLYLGESGAMAAECALLGTPSVFVSSKKLGFLDELEQDFDLVINCNNKEAALKQGLDILTNKNSNYDWQKRKNKMLQKKIDLTSFLVWFIENWPKSFYTMQNNPDYQYNFL